MRRVVSALSSALVLCVVTLGAQSLYVNSEQISVSSTAVGFTAAKISSGGQTAVRAYCTLETANIRFVIDTRTTVTSNYGELWLAGTDKTFVGGDTLQNFKSIAATSTAGQVTCTYSNP